MNSPVTRLSEVIKFTNDIYRQSRSMILDAVNILARDKDIYLTRMKAWDYSIRPSEKLLDGEDGCLRHAWTNFIDTGESGKGVMFYTEYFSDTGNDPSIFFGVFELPTTDIRSIDRWASFYVTNYLGKYAPKTDVQSHDPITTVTTSEPSFFKRTQIIGLPLISIGSTGDLQNWVVNPIAALWSGDSAAAAADLENAPILKWPFSEATLGVSGGDDDEDEEDV